MAKKLYKMTESKTQLEVWEVKERLSREIMKLPKGKRIDYIISQAKPAMDELKKKRAERKRLSK